MGFFFIEMMMIKQRGSFFFINLNLLDAQVAVKVKPTLHSQWLYFRGPN